MSQQRMALKNSTGWFAAGREVTRAMALLSDGAFKVYMHVCLTADRSTGRMKIAHGDLAVALKKSRRSIVTYLEELREHQICSIEAARNQHSAGISRCAIPSGLTSSAGSIRKAAAVWPHTRKPFVSCSPPANA